MSFDPKQYKRAWMRNFRAKKHKEYLVALGKCPVTELLLTSKYHDIHCPCGLLRNIEAMKQETILRIKLIHDVYVPVLVRDGKEIPINTYFILQEGTYFETRLI